MENFFLGMGLILLPLLSGACNNVTIPNVQFVASLGASGAQTFDLLDSTTTTLTLAQFAAQWDDLSNPKGPLVCVRTADWATLKMDLENLCSQVTCTDQQKIALQSFSSNIPNVKVKAKP